MTIIEFEECLQPPDPAIISYIEFKSHGRAKRILIHKDFLKHVTQAFYTTPK